MALDHVHHRGAHIALGRLGAALEVVLVLAAGSGVGSAAVQIARLWGATVIATASTETKRERALELGADHVVDSGDPEWGRQVWGLTGKNGVDVAFETAQLTRNNILQQASISILSQANAQPQTALQLLQG